MLCAVFIVRGLCFVRWGKVVRVCVDVCDIVTLFACLLLLCVFVVFCVVCLLCFVWA